MPRSKRCLCIDCKPATDKTAMELIMFSEPSPEKEPKSSLVSSKLTKLAPKFENDLDEEDKKLNLKLDSLRDEIKELESELGLNNFSIKKHPRIPIGNGKKSERQLLYEKISYQMAETFNFKNVGNNKEPCVKSQKKSIIKNEEKFSTPIEKEEEKTEKIPLSIFDKPVQGDFPTWILDQIVHEGKYLDVQMQLMDPNSSMMSEMLHGCTYEGMKKYFDKNKDQIKKVLNVKYFCR